MQLSGKSWREYHIGFVLFHPKPVEVFDIGCLESREQGSKGVMKSSQAILDTSITIEDFRVICGEQ